ncbi:MAG TPA: M20/M25/M40 family metallo-hydrolase [bacterium]|nr:M20/M25/M40 family metallo-hydrolase [bacterium]
MTALMQAVDGYVAEHRERWLAELAELCRYPSVAAYPEAMHAAAAWLVRRLTAAGLSARLLPNPGGFPTVFAARHGRSPRTLLFFNHYDIAAYTNPVSVEGGTLPVEVRDGRIYSRGVADDKGCCFSRIAAVEALLRTAGELPVGVKFLIFGKRRPNDPVLDDVLARYAEETASDGVVWETGAKDERDRPTASLGAKGYVYAELRTRALRAPQPSRFSILPNAAWDLVWALGSLKDPRERVLVDGFYDHVMPPSPADLAVLDELGASAGPEMLARTGARAFLLGETGPAAARRWFFEPSCTICGIEAGYTGAGERLLLPDQAAAKVEFRLVARQDPADIARKVRDHLDRAGFGHIEMEVLSQTAPYRTPADDPLVRAAQRAARTVYGRELVLRPTSIGMSPKYKFAPRPTLGLGVEYAGSQLEEPGEHIRIADWVEGTRMIAALLEEYGR